MSDWDYGGAYLRHPLNNGVISFENGSKLKTHDIFDPLPNFMASADIVFTDSPWNKGNLRSFYTKADMYPEELNFEKFYVRLFECIAEISPRVCYLEIGKEYLADYIGQMRKLYKHVTFYNSGYYHRPGNLCYVVRGGAKRVSYPLDGVDEEDIINWICSNEEYECIGDLCMGRGLVGLHAYKNGKRFVGTELNHKRLSVLVENISKLGMKYSEGL